jgi:undecaprenyl-diphosphatase
VDWRLYHAVHVWTEHHAWLGRSFGAVESWSIPVFAVATVALWLLARPGASRRWKLASASALGSAALALAVNQLIGRIWHRPRPYQAHHVARIWVARTGDQSFPSDHASAAFAIAFAIFAFDRLVGSLFLAAAVVVAGGRVVAGAHYPGDVAAGALVGLACAVVICRLAQPAVVALVRVVERLTDPLVRPLWRLGD